MTVKERAIAFNPEMAQAVFELRKWQTRRPICPQPPACNGTGRFHDPKRGSFAVYSDKSDSDYKPWPERLKPIASGHCMSNGCSREFARSFREITGIRVERACDISEEDAVAEGFQASVSPESWRCIDSAGLSWDQLIDPATEAGAELAGDIEFSKHIPAKTYFSARDNFLKAWTDIYGDADLFTWVIEFAEVSK